MISLRFATEFVSFNEATESGRTPSYFRNKPGPDIAQGSFLFQLHRRGSFAGVQRAHREGVDHEYTRLVGQYGISGLRHANNT
jgi:hypothetical protein